MNCRVNRLVSYGSEKEKSPCLTLWVYPQKRERCYDREVAQLGLGPIHRAGSG